MEAINVLTTEQYHEAQVARAEFPLPPGIDRKEVEDGILTLDQMIEKVDEVVKYYPTLEEAFDARHGEGIYQRWKETEPQKISEPFQVSANPEITPHLQAMADNTPKGGEIKQLGDLVVLSYPILDPKGGKDHEKSIQVFDMSLSFKERGLRVVGVFQESETGKTWDGMAMIKEKTEIFVKKRGWLVSEGVQASTDAKDINIYTLNTSRSLPQLVAHEASHVDDLGQDQKGMDDINDYRGMNWLRKGVRMISAILVVTQKNPFLALPSLIVSLGMYYMSRSNDNVVGKGFYRLLQTEMEAYMYGKITEAALLNQGFIVDSPELAAGKHFSPGLRQKYAHTLRGAINKENFYIGYEPTLWAIIDLIRDGTNKKKEIAPKPAPQMAMLGA